VKATVELLDGGSTVPFIARYRKEVTGMLDDAQLRTLEERLRYLRELDERRLAVLESIRSQGKLDEALEASILAADTKSRPEEVLDLTMSPDEPTDEPQVGPTDYETRIAAKFGITQQGRPGDKWLGDTVRWAWRTKILLHLGIDLRMRLRQAAEDDAVRVFAA